VKITFDLEIIQVLGSVPVEESHNFNCITFFSYSVTVFQLLLKVQLLQTLKLQLTNSDFSVISPFQLQLLLTGFTLVTSPASRTTSHPSNIHMVQRVADNGFNPSNTANTADNTNTVDDLGSACAATCDGNSTVSQPAYIIELKQQITDMKSIIQQQQCHINQLSTRLQFVLSFLDIDSNENPMEQPYSPGNTVKSGNADAAHMTVKSICTHKESSQQHVEQFEQSRQHPPANLRDAVAFAVVEDQRMRERNAKSLIVTGFTSLT